MRFISVTTFIVLCSVCSPSLVHRRGLPPPTMGDTPWKSKDFTGINPPEFVPDDVKIERVPGTDNPTIDAINDFTKKFNTNIVPTIWPIFGSIIGGYLGGSGGAAAGSATGLALAKQVNKWLGNDKNKEWTDNDYSELAVASIPGRVEIQAGKTIVNKLYQDIQNSSGKSLIEIERDVKANPKSVEQSLSVLKDKYPNNPKFDEILEELEKGKDFSEDGLDVCAIGASLRRRAPCVKSKSVTNAFLQENPRKSYGYDLDIKASQLGHEAKHFKEVYGVDLPQDATMVDVFKRKIYEHINQVSAVDSHSFRGTYKAGNQNVPAWFFLDKDQPNSGRLLVIGAKESTRSKQFLYIERVSKGRYMRFLEHKTFPLPPISKP